MQMIRICRFPPTQEHEKEEGEGEKERGREGGGGGELKLIGMAVFYVRKEGQK